MKILKNSEARLVLGLLAILLIVFETVSMYLLHSYTDTLNRAQLQQNVAVIGAVAKEYPKAETQIVEKFTRGLQGDYQHGKILLSKYGYDENLSIRKNDVVSRELWFANVRFQLLIISFDFILIILFMLSFKSIYKRIRQVGEKAEAAVEGNYQPMWGFTDEGDMGFLTYQFNAMTERLGENVQALRQEKLFLKRLVTDISHQLKTPLASLIMFNDILKNDLDMPEQERLTFIGESRNQLDRMEWLIRNLLKMARLEAGVAEFHKESAAVINTLCKSIAPLKYLADEKNIDIIVRGDENISVKHDVSWTAEAFSNIIKNSIEHSSPGEKIEISLEENKVYVQLEISDRGSGIPQEELGKIFNRFYKGPNSRNPTNIGIGLYITKTILEGQGGAVYASGMPGSGTRFVVRLMKIN